MMLKRFAIMELQALGWLLGDIVILPLLLVMIFYYFTMGSRSPYVTYLTPEERGADEGLKVSIFLFWKALTRPAIYSARGVAELIDDYRFSREISRPAQ